MTLKDFLIELIEKRKEVHFEEDWIGYAYPRCRELLSEIDAEALQEIDDEEYD